MLRTSNSLLIVFLYVDNLPIKKKLASTIAVIKYIMHDRFCMTEMGLLHFLLGIEISQYDSRIGLSQTKYARDLLVRFHMID